MFINEEVSEQDASAIDWKPFRIEKQHPFKPHKWTIDRAENAFLVRLLPRRVANIDRTIEPDLGHDALAFFWKEEVWPFFADMRIYPVRESVQVDLEWSLLGVSDWDIGPEDKIELLSLLTDALIAHGYDFDGPADVRNFSISLGGR